MDTSVVVGLITGTATIIAAAIAILPRLLRREPPSPSAGSSLSVSDGTSVTGERCVYYHHVKHRFLNFRGKNCRIEPMDGGASFLAPTHELFHDPEQKRRITRESIVVRR
jgi:hypothetical protein